MVPGEVRAIEVRRCPLRCGAKKQYPIQRRPKTIAEEVGKENFPAGRFGHRCRWKGSISFIPLFLETQVPGVVGKVSALSILGQVLEFIRFSPAVRGGPIKEVES